MSPPSFEAFFLATAGAGAALIGLLFVAISIWPRNATGDVSVVSSLHQHLAGGTLLTLTSGFLLSAVALIPGVNAGWVAAVLGAGGVVVGAHIAQGLVRSHWRHARRYGLAPHLARVVGLTVVGTGLFLAETMLGTYLVVNPGDPEAFQWIALTIAGLYGLGIVRAWTLLGDSRRGWSGWLNPLGDLDRGATQVHLGEGMRERFWPVGETSDVRVQVDDAHASGGSHV